MTERYPSTNNLNISKRVGDFLQRHPKAVETIRHRKEHAAALWEEDGFGILEVYVDESGDTVLVSKKPAENGDEFDRDVAATYRLSFSGETYEIVVPPALRGHRRQASPVAGSGSFDDVYDVTSSGDGEVEDGILEKFGPVLTMWQPGYIDGGTIKELRGGDFTGCEFDGSIREVEHYKELGARFAALAILDARRNE